MKTFLKLSVALLVFSVFGVGTMWMGTGLSVQGQSASEQAGDSQVEDPFVSVDRKARAAKSDERNAVEELGSGVVNNFAPDDVPQPNRDAMIERLVRAELNYRQGKHKGILEHDVAKTVNELADKFGAPEYAKTRRDQVRTLRVSLMPNLPHLIDQEVIEGKKDKKKPVDTEMNPYMTPLEAATVAMLMLQQKLVNEDYQVTPDEFADNLYKKKLAKWQAHRDGATDATQTEQDKKPKLRGYGIEVAGKEKEMRRKIDESTTDLSNLTDTSLDTLGIER